MIFLCKLTNVYKTLIPNVDNDIESIDSDNHKLNSLDLMCDNETNISFPEVESIDSDKENSQNNISFAELESKSINGVNDIEKLHKDNSIREHLAKLNRSQDNNIRIPNTGIPKPIASEYTSYCIIYDVINKAHVPLYYMYDLIIKVIMEEVRSERITTETKFICRRSLLKWMLTSFRGVPKPLKNIIQLETPLGNNGDGNLNHRTRTEVITLDFKEQLIDLLSDVELFSNLDNLVINNTLIIQTKSGYRMKGGQMDVYSKHLMEIGIKIMLKKP